MRERGLCFVRVQCERMAVLGPVWYRMKRFFEVTSFPLYNREPARPHRPAHMSALSQSQCTPPKLPNTLQKENTQSDPPQVSPHQYHSFHVTRIHLKSSPRSSVRQKPYTSLSYPGFRDSSLRLSQMAQQMFIIEGSSGLFSLLFLSSHCYTLSSHSTHMVCWYQDTLLLGSLSGYTIGSAALESPILVGRIVSALLYKGSTL